LKDNGRARNGVVVHIEHRANNNCGLGPRRVRQANQMFLGGRDLRPTKAEHQHEDVPFHSAFSYECEKQTLERRSFIFVTAADLEPVPQLF
jgi:hypothetical protein